jgi:hypothetical protein
MACGEGVLTGTTRAGRLGIQISVGLSVLAAASFVDKILKGAGLPTCPSSSRRTGSS